jgi:two-component system, NtrC family, sensor histidine kinase PilS
LSAETSGLPEGPRGGADASEAAAAAEEIGPGILAVVVSRVIMFAVLFWTALAFDRESFARGLVLTYGVSTALYLATWISAYRSRQASPVGFLLFFQFLVEVAVEGAIFYANGGYLSDYGLLFILTILGSGFFFGFRGALIMAALAAAIFGYAGILHLGGRDVLGLDLPFLLVETVQIRFFLYATLFFMVALLSSSLAARLAAARQALAAGRRDQELYQFSAESVMNDLPTGLVFFDAEDRLKLKNRPAEEWLGIPLRAGMGLAEAMGALLPDGVLEEIAAAREAFPMREAQVETAKGVPVHVQIKTLTREGRYLGCVFILIDFTQERRMARALLRSERMAALGAMSARIAHEIRNPLASISGAAQMLGETPAASDSDRKLTSLIVTESARLNRILTGLLDYARDRSPSLREVSVAEIFPKIRLMLEKDPGYRPGLVNVLQKVENGDIRFESDPDILVQVLLNVALNALQALPEGKGTLEFAAREDGKTVRLEVKDNGRGMGREEAARAFEPFFTNKPNGTGLGLAASLHYVQSLEGNITLETAAGAGTTVVISLPRVPHGIGSGKNGN